MFRFGGIARRRFRLAFRGQTLPFVVPRTCLSVVNDDSHQLRTSYRKLLQDSSVSSAIRTVLEQMEQEGHTPSHSEFEILIEKCMKEEDLEHTFAVVELMKKANVKPKLSLLNMIFTLAARYPVCESRVTELLHSIHKQGLKWSDLPFSDEDSYYFKKLSYRNGYSDNLRNPPMIKTNANSSANPYDLSVLLKDAEVDLHSKQLALEEQAIAMAVQKYRKTREQITQLGKASEMKPAQELLLSWYQPLVNAILEEQKKYHRREFDQDRKSYGPYLSSLNAEKLAVIAMHELMGLTMMEPNGVPFVRAASTIGRAIQGEVNYNR